MAKLKKFQKRDNSILFILLTCRIDFIKYDRKNILTKEYKSFTVNDTYIILKFHEHFKL
jgi:hypothetical protein